MAVSNTTMLYTEQALAENMGMTETSYHLVKLLVENPNYQTSPATVVERRAGGMVCHVSSAPAAC